MLIKVKNVDVSTPAGKKYQQATIDYENDRGETKSWKIFSFTNPQVFATLKGANNGDIFEITTRKNDKDYTEWSAAVKADASVKAVGGSTSSPIRSTYETPEERAVKQRLIVRQSSIGYALEYFKVKGIQEIDELTPQLITLIAQEFNDWVYQQPTLEEMPDDIPF